MNSARRLLVLLALACLAAPTLAGAAKKTDLRPELWLVEGRDWRVVLPASVLAASTHPDRVNPVLLFEPAKDRGARHLIERYAPRRALVLPTAEPGNSKDLGARLAALVVEAAPKAKVDRLPVTSAGAALALAAHVLPAGSARRVFLVDSGDYPLALRAAVLAGAERGVLIPVGPLGATLDAALGFAAAHGGSVVVVGRGDEALAGQAAQHGVKLEVLPEDALEGRTVEALAQGRPASVPAHLVLTNPADIRGYFSPPHLSVLSPLYALAKRAPLVLAAASPEDTEEALSGFEARHGPVTHITLIGDYLALGLREIKDPDQVHKKVKKPRIFKVPALSGLPQRKPAEYAVGRLAAEDAFDLSLQVGRILAPERVERPEHPVLLLSNADLKFIMAELISMTTAREMESLGIPVDAFYGARIDRELIRKEIVGKQVILWEGHPRDLTVDYEIGVVEQSLDASLVFLQGCYTLDRNDPYVMVQQGASAVIGTYMAVYSASGSAFARAFFGALLNTGADQGEAMMHARNYLLAYVELKRRRGHGDWRKTWRAGLSFDLWGDPTGRPLTPKKPLETPPVHLTRSGDALRLVIPAERQPQLRAGRYTVDLSPGAQLGSIYTHDPEWGNERRMQEVYFAWIDLPEFEKAPKVVSAIEERHYATLWSPKRRRLYLVVHNDAAEDVGRAALRFRLER